MRTPTLLSIALLAAAAASASAETISAEAVALGWQTENAAQVFVGTAESDREGAGGFELTLRVEEPIRGDLRAGASAMVGFPPHLDGKPWTQGARYLCFLEPAPAEAGAAPRFRLVSGAYGLRTLPAEGPQARFPQIARDVAATLDAAGRVADPAALRGLLVRWMGDADPGIAWSAATDFVRHEELHAALTPEERAAILAAYRRQPIGKATKAALALAVSAARPPSAAEALADTLLDRDAHLVRGAVAEALRRLRDPATEALLARRLETAGAPARKSLLVALGAVGASESVFVARRSLGDAETAVRAEAAHALGRIARNVRDADVSARVEGREDLERLAAAAKTSDERRAALWALAQLDQPEAWDALRRVAADETAAEEARAWAKRFLERPRVSLLLE